MILRRWQELLMTLFKAGLNNLIKFQGTTLLLVTKKNMEIKIIHIVIIVFILILLFGIWVVIYYKRSRKIPRARVKFFNSKLQEIKQSSQDETSIIMNYDKLLHHVLREFWYEGTLWEILKQNPSEISDINKIWELHKLRNKLAHDFDLLEETILRKNAREFFDQIKGLIGKM